MITSVYLVYTLFMQFQFSEDLRETKIVFLSKRSETRKTRKILFYKKDLEITDAQTKKLLLARLINGLKNGWHSFSCVRILSIRKLTQLVTLSAKSGPGFEPGTSRMPCERSTTVLHPVRGVAKSH